MIVILLLLILVLITSTSATGCSNQVRTVWTKNQVSPSQCLFVSFRQVKRIKRSRMCLSLACISKEVRCLPFYFSAWTANDAVPAWAEPEPAVFERDSTELLHNVASDTEAANASTDWGEEPARYFQTSAECVSKSCFLGKVVCSKEAVAARTWSRRSGDWQIQPLRRVRLLPNL